MIFDKNQKIQPSGKMKILFIGDYSNLHTTLARELRRAGHQADILSDGCGHMNLSADFYIKREKGFLGGMRYLFDLFNLLPRLKGYDVVQLINTNFLNLKPQKIKYFYDRLKEQNGSMFLTLAGDDYNYVKTCYDGKLFRFSEFKIGDEFTEAHKEKPQLLYGWISNINRYWSQYLLESINGAMAVLPEYHMAAEKVLGDKVTFTNLPVDISELPTPEHFFDDKVNIMVAMRGGVEKFKGTLTLQKIAREVKKEMGDSVNVDIVKDVSFREFLNRVAKSDIVLDQLYAYSPAMTALYGMAMGKAVGTGAQPEYYEYIGNPKERPLISLSPFDTDIKERLIALSGNREEILKRGAESLSIVQRHNSSPIVTSGFMEHWQKLG